MLRNIKEVTHVAEHVRVLEEELSDGSTVFNVRWDNGEGGELDIACEDEQQAKRTADTLAALNADFLSFEVL